jgi:hypothetical protein
MLFGVPKCHCHNTYRYEQDKKKRLGALTISSVYTFISRPNPAWHFSAVSYDFMSRADFHRMQMFSKHLLIDMISH